jgi:tetratricopeptide (TPR) repeat protein
LQAANGVTKKALMKAKSMPSANWQRRWEHLSPLIGRESELAEVKELMGTTRLLTLVGAGGIGKTRFSLEVASALLDRFKDGKLVGANERERTGDRHLAFFADQAEAFEPHFYCPDQVRWYARADAESDNFRAALDHSLSFARARNGMRVANALHRYWVARVYWREANDWFKRLLAIPKEGEGTTLRARTTFVAGHITNYYDPVQASGFAEDSLRLARMLNYKEGVINALWLIGWIYYPKLDGTAVPYLEESISLAHEIDYTWGAMHACAWYGVYKVGVGDYEAAKLALREGIAQAERIGGDSTLIGRCEGNLGQAALLQGDFVAAKASLDKSLALHKGTGNRNSIAETLWLQGRLALRQNDFALALSNLKESLALYRTYTSSVWVTRGLVYIAIAHIASGHLAPAAQLVGALNARDSEIGSIDTHLGSLASIAEYQSALEKLKAKMPATTFHAEWQVGHNLAIEQSIELALSKGAFSHL